MVQAVGELGYFHVLLDLLLLPHTNNALHLVCTACIDRVVASTSDESQPLREALLGDAELPSRLVSLLSELDAEGVATNGGASAPCAHGFAMSLCASLLSAAQREEAVRPYLESPAWEAFVAPGGRLTAWEQTQNRQLGGRAPLRDMDNESDDEVEFDAAEMQRVIAAQTAAAQAAADGDGDGGAERSSEYLQHIAQYLSERNFTVVDPATTSTPSPPSSRPPPTAPRRRGPRTLTISTPSRRRRRPRAPPPPTIVGDAALEPNGERRRRLGRRLCGGGGGGGAEGAAPAAGGGAHAGLTSTARSPRRRRPRRPSCRSKSRPSRTTTTASSPRRTARRPTSGWA